MMLPMVSYIRHSTVFTGRFTNLPCRKMQEMPMSPDGCKKPMNKIAYGNGVLTQKK